MKRASGETVGSSSLPKAVCVGAESRYQFAPRTKVSLSMVKNPLVVTCEQFINDTIHKTWELSNTFKYHVWYLGSSVDETSHFLYYQAIFSQPTISYPIPQASVSVYFRVEDKHINKPEINGVPKMTFRIEGQNTEHDVRSVLLTTDWLLAVIKMKIKLFARVEAFQMF